MADFLGLFDDDMPGPGIDWKVHPSPDRDEGEVGVQAGRQPQHDRFRGPAGRANLNPGVLFTGVDGDDLGPPDTAASPDQLSIQHREQRIRRRQLTRFTGSCGTTVRVVLSTLFVHSYSFRAPVGDEKAGARDTSSKTFTNAARAVTHRTIACRRPSRLRSLGDSSGGRRYFVGGARLLRAVRPAASSSARGRSVRLRARRAAAVQRH